MEEPLQYSGPRPPVLRLRHPRVLGPDPPLELVERRRRPAQDREVDVGHEPRVGVARRLVVAGGETSGAVVKALGIKGLRIGAQIDPGVPCTVTLSDPPLALALKSGNFGGPDFFGHALEVMP